MSKIIIKLLSGALNILTCLIVVAVFLYRQNWFGKDDTYSFIFWTIPIAIGLSINGENILNIFRNTHILLRLIFIAIISVFLSWVWVYSVASILGPWIGAFSIPIFYLWIIGNGFQLLFLDWRLPKSAHKPKFLKLLLNSFALPVILLISVITILSFSFLASYLTKPEKELYLIPSNFEGRFRVVYGEKCGINPRNEDGRRVLRIPTNGVLIIQPKFKAGIIDNEYYLINKNESRRKISIAQNYTQQNTQLPSIMLDRTGVMGGAMPDGGSSSESPLAIRYTDFTLFNKDTLSKSDRNEFLFQQHFDSLTSSLVEKCRSRNSL